MNLDQVFTVLGYLYSPLAAIPALLLFLILVTVTNNELGSFGRGIKRVLSFIICFGTVPHFLYGILLYWAALNEDPSSSQWQGIGMIALLLPVAAIVGLPLAYLLFKHMAATD